jgi:hypothetical protein
VNGEALAHRGLLHKKQTNYNIWGTKEERVAIKLSVINTYSTGGG